MEKRTVGECIALLRKRLGISQRELAELLGVTDKAVSKWERGVSLPDVTLLSPLAEALQLSVDSLLRGEIPDEVPEVCVSLEKYLSGELGFWVPDLHPREEEAILLLDSPELDDAKHGVALTGRSGEIVAHHLLGEERGYGWETEARGGRLGVVYISNVPLLNLTPPIDRLTSELEYTRIGRYEINLHLLKNLGEKLSEIIHNERIRRIAITRECNQKYLFAVLAHASPALYTDLLSRIREGSLELLHILPPALWDRQEDVPRAYGTASFIESLR